MTTFPPCSCCQSWQHKAAHDIQSWAQWHCKRADAPALALWRCRSTFWSPETDFIRFRAQPRVPPLRLSTGGLSFRAWAVYPAGHHQQALGLVECRNKANERGGSPRVWPSLRSFSATSRDCREVLWSRLNTEPFDFLSLKGSCRAIF